MPGHRDVVEGLKAPRVDLPRADLRGGVDQEPGDSSLICPLFIAGSLAKPSVTKHFCGSGRFCQLTHEEAPFLTF